MKVKILLILLLFNTFDIKSQVYHHDFKFNSVVITQLNDPLLAALNRHFEVLKNKNIIPEKDFFIIVAIYPSIRQSEVPKSVFDSIYAVNDFKTNFPLDSVTPSYNFMITLANKKYFTNGWSGFTTAKNIYYHKFNNYDVLLISGLDLIFNNNDEKNNLDIHIVYDEQYIPHSSYKISTYYTAWNRYVRENRWKDLIWPNWTGNFDDFE
jgi:hypothetical protein